MDLTYHSSLRIWSLFLSEFRVFFSPTEKPVVLALIRQIYLFRCNIREWKMPPVMRHLRKETAGQLELLRSKNTIFLEPKKMAGSLTGTAVVRIEQYPGSIIAIAPMTTVRGRTTALQQQQYSINRGKIQRYTGIPSRGCVCVCCWHGTVTFLSSTSSTTSVRAGSWFLHTVRHRKYRRIVILL